MLRKTALLLALVLTLQVSHASAAQNGEALTARITDAIKVYEADWTLVSSTHFPRSEWPKYEPLSFNWERYGEHYVWVWVRIHTTEEDAIRTLKRECNEARRKGEVSALNVDGLGDETYEWKGTGLFDKDHGYYFRKGKVVVTVDSSLKPAAKSFASRIADQL